MPRLQIGNEVREIDLIVFDKDGTLVDFDRLWAGKLIHAAEKTLSAVGNDPEVRRALLGTLGVDMTTMSVIPESPLAVSSLAKLGMACSIVLYQQGVTWHQAEVVSREIFMPAIEAVPAPADLLPIGDVAGLMARLSASGFHLAVFTSDDRKPTEASLPLLGLTGHIRTMVCGDDPIANKPSGDGLLHLAGQFGVAPERVLMIGDSVTDMTAARHANVGWRMGVLSGTGRKSDLEAIAETIAPDIHALRTV